MERCGADVGIECEVTPGIRKLIDVPVKDRPQAFDGLILAQGSLGVGGGRRCGRSDSVRTVLEYTCRLIVLGYGPATGSNASPNPVIALGDVRLAGWRLALGIGGNDDLISLTWCALAECP